MSGAPTFETLEQELDVVVKRHIELFHDFPGLTASTLFQLVDHYRIKYGVEIDEVSDEGDGLFMIYMNDGERAAALGVDGPDNLERATSLATMLPEEIKRGPVS